MKAAILKRTPTMLLKTVIILFGIAVLAFLLIEPNFEGVNANATLFEVYFTDPFLAYVYISSIPFFTALYQALQLLRNIEQDNVFSQISVNALRNIKYCLIVFIGFIAIAIPYISIMGRLHNDDPAGAVALGLVILLASIICATAANVFQKLLQNAVDIKSERDLTV